MSRDASGVIESVSGDHDWGGWWKVREMIELIKQKKISLNALGLVRKML